MSVSWRLLAVLIALALAGCAARDAAVEPAAEPVVLVAGGSGRVGRYVLTRLTEQGRPLRALTRDRAAAVERWGPDFAAMEWLEGDVRDAARMREVMRGVSQVICVIGSRELTGPNSAEFVDFGGVVNLVVAAREAGVSHFVLLTAIGASDPAHPFNKATKGALEWRFRGEEYLRDSGLSYTIVRPAGLQDRPAGEQGLRVGQGDDWRPFLRSTLSRDDLALVLIAALTAPASRNVTLELANDPALEPGSWAAVFDGLVPDPPR